MRNQMVEKVKAGDKCFFIGTLIAIPDVYQMFSKNVESRTIETPNNEDDPANKNKDKNKVKLDPNDGLTGLKVLGVRDLSYKLCFLSNSVEGESLKMDKESEFDSEIDFIKSLTDLELTRINQIKKEKNLYDKLAKSIAPK